MNLDTLIKHSAHLVSIVSSRTKAADTIITPYLRGKKYIGSKERRFISETVYSTLRMFELLNCCVSKSLKNNDSDNTLNQIFKERLNYSFLLCSSCCLISDYLPPGRKPFEPNDLLSKIYSVENSFQDELSSAISSYFSLDETLVKHLVESIIQSFDNLVSKADLLLKNKLGTDVQVFETLGERYSIQPWILKSWIERGAMEDNLSLAASNADALLYPADLNLRVNTLKINRNDTIQKLNDSGLQTLPTIYSPFGIIIKSRTNLYENNLYRNGCIEVQDEGSQLISLALNPSEGSLILDACAGAGGKTLSLAALTKNNSFITAVDTDRRKLDELMSRANRAGAKNITTLTFDKLTSKIDSFREKLYDYVLVDAPCSGIGTARRSPMLKQQLTPDSIIKRQATQLKILGFYAQFVKINGILVYSTCSLMPEENEIVIEIFLKANPNFIGESISEVFKQQEIEIPSFNKVDSELTLLPSIHKCDGFFIARLKKV